MEHEGQRNLETEEHETNLDQPDRTTPTQSTKPHEPTARELTHCSYGAWCAICVGAKSLDGHRKRQNFDEVKIPMIEFDCTFRTDRPVDPRAKIGEHGRDGFYVIFLFELDGKAKRSWV